MKYLYLMLVLLALPVCAQDVAEVADSNPAAEAQKSDTAIVEAPRVRVMPFLPYTGTAGVERVRKKKTSSGTVVESPVVTDRGAVVQERSFGIVFNDGSVDLNPDAVEKMKQAAQKMHKYGFTRFALITYYQEGNPTDKTLANRRLEIVNNSFFDMGFKKTIQAYAYPRKQVIVNKDTVIVIPK